MVYKKEIIASEQKALSIRKTTSGDKMFPANVARQRNYCRMNWDMDLQQIHYSTAATWLSGKLSKRSDTDCKLGAYTCCCWPINLFT